MPDGATADGATPDEDGETRALAATKIRDDATRVRPPGRMPTTSAVLFFLF
jgi:hypothetical protein